MPYYHWSSEPIKLRKMNYLQSGHPKPNGLWFDANGGWKTWCEAEQFRLETIQYRHTVSILNGSRILRLRTAKEIDAFTRRYGRNRFSNIQLLQSGQELDAFTNGYGRNLFSEIQQKFGTFILWEEVAEKHTGIIIIPYSRARSQAYLWYYGWGCASGCVWDTSVIRLGKPCKIT